MKINDYWISDNKFILKLNFIKKLNCLSMNIEKIKLPQYYN